MSDSDKLSPAEEADLSASSDESAPGAPSKLMEPKTIAREVSLIFVLSLLLVLGVVLLGNVVPLVQQNLYVLVASIFVGVPYFWLRHLRADFDHFGLTYARAGRGILWGLLFTALTLGPFAIGYAVWQQQILGNELDFSSDNFYQWPLEIKGRPAGWDALTNPANTSAQTPTTAIGNGRVWLWTQGSTLRIGVASGSGPVDLYLQANRTLAPDIRGPAKLMREHSADANRATIRLDQTNAHSEIIFKHRKGEPVPKMLKVHAKNLDTGDSIAVFQGPKEARGSGILTVKRGLGWVLLWLLTEIMFIALPEEFFYRGYLMTRLKHFFDMRVLRRAKRAAGDAKPAPKPRRRILGISAENLTVSLLFAVGHVLIPIGGVLLVSRASVFFPSLAFGWLRERTDSIVAPVVYHAAANMMVLLAAPHFF